MLSWDVRCLSNPPRCCLEYEISVTTSYAAINATINYIADVKPYPKKATLPLLFPTTNDAILEKFRTFLRSPETQAGSPNAKRVCVIDSLISMPGILLPWKEMVKICKDEEYSFTHSRLALK